MSKSNEVKVYGSRSIPLFLFTHPGMPLPKRVLLVMATMADRKGVCHLGIRTLAKLVGHPVGDAKGKEAQEKLNPVRVARQSLIKAGFLVTIKEDSEWGPRYSHQIIDTGTPDYALEGWNSFGRKKNPKVCYSDKAWVEAEAAEPEEADADGQDQLQAWLDAGG